MMRLCTVLNRCTRFKRFVFERVRFDDEDRILVSLRPRANSRPVCSRCGMQASVYDTSGRERLFEFVPLWGYRVFFVYRMRRVKCSRCGVVVERVPWATGKHQLTDVYRCFLAHWAGKLSWKDVAESFRTSWRKVYESVKFVVDYGLARRRLDDVSALGVDEIQYRSGHRYLTLVYQIDQGVRRLLWIGRDRTSQTLDQGLCELDAECQRKHGNAGGFLSGIRYVCSDMWRPYLRVASARLPEAVHILDRFHIMQHFGRALDKVRTEEARRLQEQGCDPVLNKTRFCFLKRRENLTQKQRGTLAQLLRMNLRIVRAYLLKEDFQRFWEYQHPAWAGKFLDRWCDRAVRSRIKPMKQVANMLRRHRELLLNWFRARKQFNSGIVEGLNLKWVLTVRKSFGFRTFQVLETASFHQLGHLPEPTFTHTFW